MGIDTVTPGQKEITEEKITPPVTHVENARVSPIIELIPVAETIEQIVYIAYRIRQERPGGQEWSQLSERARSIIDGYIQQVQADPKKLDELRKDVAHLDRITLLDVTEIQTAMNKLNTAADEAAQREIAAAQELPPFIKEAQTLAQIVLLASDAEKNGQKKEWWPQLRKRAEQMIEAYKTQIQTDPSRVSFIRFDLLSLQGTTLFTEYEINELLSRVR